MDVFLWTMAVYLAIGGLWLGGLALYAWGQGGSIGWGDAIRNALGWPYVLWQVFGR